MFTEIRHETDQGLKIPDKVLKNMWHHTANTSSKRECSLKGSLVSTPGSPGANLKASRDLLLGSAGILCLGDLSLECIFSFSV